MTSRTFREMHPVPTHDSASLVNHPLAFWASNMGGLDPVHSQHPVELARQAFPYR